MLMPSSVPITHGLFDGHVIQIRTDKISVTTHPPSATLPPPSAASATTA
jgi:hypothetical protein